MKSKSRRGVAALSVFAALALAGLGAGTASAEGIPATQVCRLPNGHTIEPPSQAVDHIPMCNAIR